MVLLIDRYDRRPHLFVRVKCYVYDHGFEPRPLSDGHGPCKDGAIAKGIITQSYGLGGGHEDCRSSVLVRLVGTN